MLREPLTLTTTDGLRLEAELALPSGHAWAGAVLTHPHPRHGGNMKSMVPGELIRELPALGVATLRFNFRGMGASEGSFEDGVGERLDVAAAVGALHELVEGLPLVVFGSSFGADTALTVADERINGWCALAPPLRESKLPHMKEVAEDTTRPKRLVVAERDQYRVPKDISVVTAEWKATEMAVIPGSDHFFVGRLDLAIAAATEFMISFQR